MSFWDYFWTWVSFLVFVVCVAWITLVPQSRKPRYSRKKERLLRFAIALGVYAGVCGLVIAAAWIFPIARDFLLRPFILVWDRL